MSEAHRTRHITTVAVLVAAALAVGVSTFLAWVTTGTGAGGRVAVSGWGEVSGGSALDGMNINSVVSSFGGTGSYRPALVAMGSAVVILVAALILAIAGPGRRHSRPLATVWGAAGLVAACWAMVHIVDPGDLMGILRAGERTVGAGPYVALAAGAVSVAGAVVVVCGALDPPAPTVRRGIQPRP